MTLAALIARLRAGSQVSTAEVLGLLEELQRRHDDPDRTMRIVDKATEVARMWRDQDGINANYLDQLAVEVLEDAASPAPAPAPAPAARATPPFAPGLSVVEGRRRRPLKPGIPTLYPCGCSHLKVAAGRCSHYKPGEVP